MPRSVSITNEAWEYVKALRGLNRDGVHGRPIPDLLTSMPFVRSYPDAATAAAATNEEAAFIAALRTLIETEFTGDHREALLALFAFDHRAAQALKDRYRSIASKRGHLKWEAYSKDPRQRDLNELYLAMRRAGRVEPTARRRTDFMDRTNYQTEFYEAVHTFPEKPGDPWDTIITRKIVALEDGFTTWRQNGQVTGAKLGRDLPRLRLLDPGELQILQDAPVTASGSKGRAYITEVRFPDPPLRRGQDVTFRIQRSHAFDFERATAAGYQETVGLNYVTAPIRCARVSVHFSKTLVPKTIWAFADMPSYLMPGEPDQGTTLSVDSTGRLSWEWSDLAIGYAYGIAWRW